MGTKEYRKPEWVKQLEEKKKLLKGNHHQDRLATTRVKTNSFNEFFSNKEVTAPNSRETYEAPLKPVSINLSSIISPSMTTVKEDTEPPKIFHDTLENSSDNINEYTIRELSDLKESLEAVRNSLQRKEAEIEISILSESDESDSEFEFLEAECEVSDEEGKDTVDDDSYGKNSFYILSPIQESSEGSSNSTDNQVTDCKNHNIHEDGMRLMSSSLHVVSVVREDEDPLSKSQTFPRSKIATRRQPSEKEYNPNLYPFEPRELDPSFYHQLHAADSQEELQEFLLLETECMETDSKRGLAAAFTSSEIEDVATNSESDNLPSEGNS